MGSVNAKTVQAQQPPQNDPSCCSSVAADSLPQVNQSSSNDNSNDVVAENLPVPNQSISKDSCSNDDYESARSDLDANATPAIHKHLPKKIISAVIESSVNEPVREMKDENILITVTNPRKVGTGISSFMLFTVNTKLLKDSMLFKKPFFSVDRRYGDFMSLRDNLIEKHKPAGFLIPPPPEKNVVAMTLVKMTPDEDTVSHDFIEKRRAALERYLNRLARHSVLSKDQMFLKFLEQDGLPKSSTPSTLGAGTGIIKLVSKAFSSTNLELSHERDAWFEKITCRIDHLENLLSSLHKSYESHITNHKSVAVAMTELAASLTSLGSFEENKEFGSGLRQFAQCLVMLGSLHQEQSSVAYYHASEIFNDHLRIYGEVKDLLHMRIKLHHSWSDSVQELKKVRDNLAKLKAAGKPAHQVREFRDELSELTSAADGKRLDFSAFSAAVKTDVDRFEKESIVELRHMILMFLYHMIRGLERSVYIWQQFMPEEVKTTAI